MDTSTSQEAVELAAEETPNAVGYPIAEKILLAVSVVLNIATWLVVVLRMPYTSDTVILHYNTYFGVDLSGRWWQLLIAPFFGAAVIGIHAYGFKPFDRSHRAMRIVSYAIMTIVQAMLLIGMLLLIPYNS